MAWKEATNPQLPSPFFHCKTKSVTYYTVLSYVRASLLWLQWDYNNQGSEEHEELLSKSFLKEDGKYTTETVKQRPCDMEMHNKSDIFIIIKNVINGRNVNKIQLCGITDCNHNHQPPE